MSPCGSGSSRHLQLPHLVRWPPNRVCSFQCLPAFLCPLVVYFLSTACLKRGALLRFPSGRSKLRSSLPINLFFDQVELAPAASWDPAISGCCSAATRLPLASLCSVARSAGSGGVAATTHGGRQAGRAAGVTAATRFWAAGGGAVAQGSGLAGRPAVVDGSHGAGAGRMRGGAQAACGVAVPRRPHVPALPRSRCAMSPGAETTWSCCWQRLQT